MISTCYRISFSSELPKVKTEVKRILEYIKGEFFNLSDEDLFDLRIIYSELIINAIIHGNCQNSGKPVELLIEIGEDTLISKVKDSGPGFDYSHLFSTDRTSGGNCSELGEKGRGLKIVFYLVDEITFNDIGNEITFKKYMPNRIDVPL